MNINRFFSQQVSRKMHRKLFIHRKRWFLCIFKPYLLPQISKLKAAIFALFSTFVPLPNTENFFSMCHSVFEIFNFFPKKSIINWPVLYIIILFRYKVINKMNKKRRKLLQSPSKIKLPDKWIVNIKNLAGTGNAQIISFDDA